MIRVAEFREFFEFYRGEKEYLLGVKLTELYHDVNYKVFVPSYLSPLDRQFGISVSDFLRRIGSLNKITDDNRYGITLYKTIPLKITHEYSINIPQSLSGLFKIVKIFNPDVIVDIPYTTFTIRSYYVYLIARALKVPLILFYSGDLPRRFLRMRLLATVFEKNIIDYSSLIISYNKASILHLAKFFGNEVLRKSYVLDKLINYERFKPCLSSIEKKICFRLRKELGIGSKFVIGYTGRLELHKGIAILLDLARLINKDVELKKKTTLLIVGDGSLLPAVKKTVNKENLPIILLGRVRNEIMPWLYNLMDVIVFPIVRGMSTTLLESMACSKVILAGLDDRSSTKLLAHVLINEYTCKVIEADSKAFFEVIREMVNNRNHYQKIGENARNYVIKKLNFQKICSKYHDLLLKAANKKS